MAHHSLRQLRVASNLQEQGGGGGAQPPFADIMLMERLLDGMSIDGMP